MSGALGRAKQVAVRPELAHGALRPLPLVLVLAIADRLPADDKLRLAFVSPAFRAVADERCLYQDVQLGAGCSVGRASDMLLRAVSTRARGTMRTLDVSGQLLADEDDDAEGVWEASVASALSFVTLQRTVTDNAATLQHLIARCPDGVWGCLLRDWVVQLRTAAPRLRSLDADLVCSPAESHALLRDGVVRVRRLVVSTGQGILQPAADTAAALVADLAAHPTVQQLGLDGVPLPTAALDGVVRFAVERRLAWLMLNSCRPEDAPAMPAFTRLVEADCLVVLDVYNADVALPPPTRAFCAALRASRLQRLTLNGVRLWARRDAGLALVAAVTAHPTLRLIGLSYNRSAHKDREAVGSALGQLVGANAPALTSLDVWSSNLGDEGLRPLFAALPGNTRLLSLQCQWNGISRPFGAEVLAAVQANTSLTKLEVVGRFDEARQAQQAEALVALRAAVVH